MSLDLLHHQLIVSLVLLVASTQYEVLVTAEHVYRRVECLHAIVVALVATRLVACERVTLLALDDGLADRQLVRGQENTGHETATVVARHFVEQAHLFVLDELLVRGELREALVDHLTFILTAASYRATTILLLMMLATTIVHRLVLAAVAELRRLLLSDLIVTLRASGSRWHRATLLDIPSRCRKGAVLNDASIWCW